MTARQGSALDHSLLGHAGPTDIDVAMFHRDAGGGEALGLSRHILNSFGLKEITPCVGCGCVVMSFSWCLAVAPQQAADRRERQQLCRLAQPLPGQIGKGIISPQGAKDRGKNCPGSCWGGPWGHALFPGSDTGREEEGAGFAQPGGGGGGKRDLRAICSSRMEGCGEMEPGSSHGCLVVGQRQQAQAAPEGWPGSCERAVSPAAAGSVFLEAVGAQLALPWEQSPPIPPLPPSLGVPVT